MLKIRALNRESSSDEDVPVIRREAQEEIVLELYNKALRLQASGSFPEAQSILYSLINENIPNLENNGGLPKSMSSLKYSCYCNLGNIYLQRNEIKNALDKFLMASELDSADVTLWFKIGKLALKQDLFRQSAYAFSKGLECSENHWPCLDQLISVLFTIKDTVGCLEYIGKALQLDSNYTKGLVFRKQIYLDNPFTKEYYQLYNPDHIWEPSLDIEVDEEDSLKFLKEVEELSQRIIAAEKRVGPQSLTTIPLPKALESFTWTSLAKTILHLHQYINDNEMTHFTMVDLNKCMSQENEQVVTTPPVELCEEPPVEVEKKNSAEEPSVIMLEEIAKDRMVELNAEEEIMDVPEGLVERRISQNSETNNEAQDNTPVQTDNDEETPMEIETDEQDESESKTERCRPRSTKRKRDVLSELQIWGWHSKRRYSKKGKQDKDFSVTDAFNRIIPKTLLKTEIGFEITPEMEEDSMNTMDLYNLYVEDCEVNAFITPIHSPFSTISESYFGTDLEKDDALQFWTKQRNYCDAIVLVKELVFTISKLWHLQWPKELVPLYIQAYDFLREHCDLPEIFADETPFDVIRDYALATLLYGELINFTSDTTELVHASLLNFVQMVSGWYDHWKEEYTSFFNRVHWLRSHIFRKENNNNLAIRALQLVQETIVDEESRLPTGKYVLTLPNCNKCCVISMEIADKILQHLDLISSLSNVEELFNRQKFSDVADIIKITFKQSGVNHSQIGRMGRPAQLGLLLHSLWFTNKADCFIWTEECLYECLKHYLKPGKSFDKWELMFEKCLAFLYELIKMETVSIVDSLIEAKRCRLVESLTKIIIKQLKSDSLSKKSTFCVTPWILLHYILLREEHRLHASNRVSHIASEKPDTLVIQETKEAELPSSIAILCSAHEFLGPKGWCVTDNGELLHFILDTVLDRLDTPIFEPLREKIDIHIEQALFCLYQHPSKKNKVSRHLADHNVDPLPLSFERSFQLYEFYGPDSLPEFNSYKNASISADLEQLLKRISALVPSEFNPQTTLEQVMAFVNGKSDEMPEAINFPNKVRSIYYLIGDYYFKQREFNRCLKYFEMDLCINPLRIDSWACLGLSFVSQLESKLNYCKKIKSETDFLEKAKSAQICFKKALNLAPDHLMLWIEFGSFEYMVHSFCSRLLKFESENFSMEKFDILEGQKNSYLDSSGNSLEKAISLYEVDENEPDERWLQYYILGKIAEKKQKEPTEYLQYYLTASTLLKENNATYPDKINYYNPQHLAVEALELHYRVHASILKYLELHEGKVISHSLGTFFKKCLNSTNNFQKVAKELKPTNDNSADILMQQEVKQCLDELLLKVEEETKIASVLDGKPGVIVLSDSDEDDKKGAKVEKQQLDIFKEVVKPCKEVTVEIEKASKLKTVDSETDAENIRTSVDDSSTSNTSSSSSSSSSDSDSDDDSSSSSSSSSDNENMSSNEILQLVDRCISGLEICIKRLPQNYKALYRLAHLYYNYKGKKDFSKCRQLLLSQYKCKDGSIISGLFSEKKANNFFHGIWRIPSSEIDRPGSLSAHMSRCISILLQVLRATNDNKTLIDLCMHLKKAPDPDKVYIKDSERMQFSDQAMAMCTQSLRSQVKDVSTMQNPAIVKVLQEIFKVYQRVQKHMQPKDNPFAIMLTELYRQFIKEKIPDNVNILELATKFCQQNRPDKPKPQPALTQPTPAAGVSRGATTGVASPPVLQSASSAVLPSTVPTNYPLKRPGAGRPRGRPPLPKLPGQQTRSPRGRSPSTIPNPYSWRKPLFDQAYAHEYYKHYQEQLIKQYSQTLSIQQLQQLTQYLAQNQLSASPLVGGESLANPFLQSQTSSCLLGSMGIAATEMMQASASNSTALDQLKYFGILQQTQSSSKKMKSTHSKASTSSKFAANALTKTTSSQQQQQLFKEPTTTKQPIEKSPLSNVVMKEWPNISITPVTTTNMVATTVTSTANSFPAPKLPTSPGKTLQEKLADKQRQQQNKQITKKNIEAELFSKQDPISSASLIKNYNLPNIPASLTVSKSQYASVAQTLSPKYPPMEVSKSLYSAGGASKFPLEVLNKPSFSMESGLSISQVANQAASASKPHSPSSKPDKQFKSRASTSSASKASESLPRKSLDYIFKEISKMYPHMTMEQISAIAKEAQNALKSSAKMESSSKPNETSLGLVQSLPKKCVATEKQKISIRKDLLSASPITQLQAKRSEISITPSTPKKDNIVRREISLPKSSITPVVVQKLANEKKQAVDDDDVICID